MLTRYLLATSLHDTNMLSGYLNFLKELNVSFMFGFFSEVAVKEQYLRLRQVHLKNDRDNIQTLFFKIIFLFIVIVHNCSYKIILIGSLIYILKLISD